jgi:methylated-DNA-[protein]-cysteine S-methyltransferase
MSYVFRTMKSPVGLLKLVGSDAGLAAVLREHDDPRRVRLWYGPGVPWEQADPRLRLELSNFRS